MTGGPAGDLGTVTVLAPLAADSVRPHGPPTSRGWKSMSDVAFVVLTIALFGLLALALRGVERL
jgi:hypothetical protein